MLRNPTLFRYAFLGLWFVAVPFALAFVAVQLLEGPEDMVATGLFGLVRSFVRDQPIPAGIILFTIFEMMLYSLRHHLPLSSHLSVAGRQGLPLEVRRDFESAGHLLEEAERILKRRGKAVERDIPAKTRRELRLSLEALREAMQAEPFAVTEFTTSYQRASETAQHLDPWRKSAVREYIESIGIAILVALLLRAVVVEAFKIPSGSMLPTLQIDDHIFVNKFIYGPVVPFTNNRFLSAMPPSRGDVIVFEFPDPDPRAPRQDFIKRVIGLPGDRLEVDGGHPIINGWRVPNCRVGPYQYAERSILGGPQAGRALCGVSRRLCLPDAVRAGPFRRAPRTLRGSAGRGLGIR